MVSYRIKDNRQRNLPPKIEVTKEDKVIVRFNEPWIEMELNIVEPVRDYIMSVKQVYSKIN